MEAGDLNLWQGYPDIVRTAYEAPDEELVEALKRLITQSDDVNAKSPYGDTAVTQCFSRRAFAAMRLLIRHGADVSAFEWSADHLAIAMNEVPVLNAGAPELMQRSAAGLTPFLQACRLGNVKAAKYLEPITPEAGKRVTPDDEGPLMMASRSGSVEMVGWLLAQGYSIDETDCYGGTALLDAVEYNDLELVRLLLERGANTRKGRNVSQSLSDKAAANKMIGGKIAESIAEDAAKAISGVPGFEETIVTPGMATDEPNILKLLLKHGVPLEDFDREDISILTGADKISETKITSEMFYEQAFPRVGKSNPERVDIPFWREQIRTGRCAYSAEADCLGENKGKNDGRPVWSFRRFGRTGTRLPDGRWVLVAGEHEDHYDPDFCIYADVTVIHPDARVDHYIYPKDIFPPTDFHTATLLGDHILLIGNLGCLENRQEGKTQVLRLNLADFSVQPMLTAGQNPGWINRHKAVLGDGCITVSGGKVEPGYVDSTEAYELDLATMVWRQL